VKSKTLPKKKGNRTHRYYGKKNRLCSPQGKKKTIQVAKIKVPEWKEGVGGFFWKKGGKSAPTFKTKNKGGVFSWERWGGGKGGGGRKERCLSSSEPEKTTEGKN